MKLEQLVDLLKQKYGIDVNVTRVKERLESDFQVKDFQNIPGNIALNFTGQRISLGAYGRIHDKSRTTILMYRDMFKSYQESDNKILDIEAYWTCNSQLLIKALDRIANLPKYAKLRERIIAKAIEEADGIEKTLFRALDQYSKKL